MQEPFETISAGLRPVATTGVLLVALAQPSVAKDRAAREAVANLEANAAYKSGKYTDAKDRWEILADKGNTTALLNLANVFEQGHGVDRDLATAAAYLERAAALGDTRA